MAACSARAAWAACDGFGIARDTATTFHVFSWLQVANLYVSLLHSVPHGPDHVDIEIFVFCLHDQLFRRNVRFRMPIDPIIANIVGPLPLFEIALVLVRLDHVASGIVNASLRGFGHASKAMMDHEQYGRSVKARLQRQRRETAMLVERAHSLMRESRKLLEQREAQLKRQEQFLKQRATIAHEMI